MARRLRVGVATWEDFHYLFKAEKESLKPWLYASMLASVKTRDDGELPVEDQPIGCVAQVAAHPPEQTLGVALVEFLQQVQDGWLVAPIEDRQAWAYAQLLLGDATGDRLRRRLWSAVPGGWRPRKRVWRSAVSFEYRSPLVDSCEAFWRPVALDWSGPDEYWAVVSTHGHWVHMAAPDD